MKTISFATTNIEKLAIAQTVCGPAGIAVNQVQAEIDEIQGEDAVLIVKDKAMRAFDVLHKPVVVSDDSWDIPALHGFPGAYMKSINKWFSSEDFLRLMYGIEDRTIILHQYLAYTEGKNITVFKNDIHGKITSDARGNNTNSPNMSVTALDADGGKTIAEIFEQGKDAVVQRYTNHRDVWHEFVDWYKTI